MDRQGSGYARAAEMVLGPDGQVVLRTVVGGDSVQSTIRWVTDDSLAQVRTAPKPGAGFLIRKPDGHFEGRWWTDDGAEGWEVLRRRDDRLPTPTVVERYQAAAGTIRIGPGPSDLFPRTDLGYTLITPGGGATVRAVVVIFDGFRVSNANLAPVEHSLEAEALHAGVAILRLTTGDPLDFLFADDAVDTLLERMEGVVEEHRLEGVPLLFTGLSLAGTRAARAAIRLREEPGRFPSLSLRALAVVDAPLDMARMFRSETKARRDRAHPAAAGEAAWVLFRLQESLGAGPIEARAAFERYSPVSESAEDGGRMRALVGLAVRAYHEPDIDWWIANRSKNYYQINSPDLALLVERLRALGGRADLVTTWNARDGVAFGSTPHTWTIVDNKVLIAWFLNPNP